MVDKMLKKQIDCFKNISLVSLSGIALSSFYMALNEVTFFSGVGSCVALFGTAYGFTGIIEAKRIKNKIQKTKISTTYNECVDLYIGLIKTAALCNMFVILLLFLNKWVLIKVFLHMYFICMV